MAFGFECKRCGWTAAAHELREYRKLGVCEQYISPAPAAEAQMWVEEKREEQNGRAMEF